MNRNSKRLSVYISLMLLGTLAATALRTAALFSSLDEWGYFGDKGLITAAVITVAATSVIMLTYPLAAARVSLVPSFSSPATYPVINPMSPSFWSTLTLVIVSFAYPFLMKNDVEKKTYAENPKSVVDIKANFSKVNLSVVVAIAPKNKASAIAGALFLSNPKDRHVISR